MILSKKLSQEKIVIFFVAFIIFTINLKLLLFIILSPFSEDSLFILLFLFLLIISLSATLLAITFRKTIKPILIIFLLGSSVFSYALNNFDLMFSQDFISENSTLISHGFLWLINLKSFMYLFILGLLPSYFLLKTVKGFLPDRFLIEIIRKRGQTQPQLF